MFGITNETDNQLVTAAVVLNPGYENIDVNTLKKIVNGTLFYIRSTEVLNLKFLKRSYRY